jgi:citronellol/citronellal dehydrogenase
MERLGLIEKQLVPASTTELSRNDLAATYKFHTLGDLKGKTLVITGASRGIGLAIAKRAAKDGANIAILAKTSDPNPKLPGTIYSAAKEIESVGGKALPIQVDIRDENAVKKAIELTVKTFGGIDILVNNASAISLTGTPDTDMKRYDLMHQINGRGTFMVSKYCIPHLLKAKNPHILNISPPLNMQAKWFANHVAYTMAKYTMSLCVLGMAEEFKPNGIAVNALWPKTAIATAAVENLLGGKEAMNKSRTDAIMADAAYVILTNCSKQYTGQFYVDERVLLSSGVKCFKKYRVDPAAKEEDLAIDFFLNEEDYM